MRKVKIERSIHGQTVAQECRSLGALTKLRSRDGGAGLVGLELTFANTFVNRCLMLRKSIVGLPYYIVPHLLLPLGLLL